MATTTPLEKLKSHLRRYFLIGYVNFLSDQKDYLLITAVDEYTGDALTYPDGKPTDDILFWPQTDHNFEVGVWLFIKDYELLTEKPAIDKPARLIATQVESFSAINIFKPILNEARGQILGEFSDRERALSQLEQRLEQQQENLRKKEAALQEQKKSLATEESRLNEWNHTLEQKESDLNQRFQKLADDEKALEKRWQEIFDQNLEVAKNDADLDQRLKKYGLDKKNIESGNIKLSDDLIEILWSQESVREKLRNEKLPELLELDFAQKQQIIHEQEQRVNNSLIRWGFQPISTNGTGTQESKEVAEISTESELIEQVDAYLRSKNYSFEWNEIVNFYTAMKTGVIIILAGLSGTGKSSLVRLFAEAVSARFVLVPVKATWSDDADLMGFYHPTEKMYVATPFLDAVVEALANPNQLYFICLDEMNLSRVEYYFSDFLSILEQSDSHRKLDLYSKYEWELRQAALERERQQVAEGYISQTEFNFKERNVHTYRHELSIPSNIVICGTVNIDETTKPFSDKVLDRAQIIQFEEIAFGKQAELYAPMLPTQLTFDQFQEFKVKGETSLDDDWFNNLNDCLKIGGFHFGHRVKRQIEDYCAYANYSRLFKDLHEAEIIDIQLVQKILPKLRGFRTEKIQNEMFPRLLDFCVGSRAKAKIEAMATMESMNYWQVTGYVDQN